MSGLPGRVVWSCWDFSGSSFHTPSCPWCLPHESHGPGHGSQQNSIFFIFSPPGDSGDGGLAGQHDSSSKVGLWLCREPRTRDLPWDTSSTDSGGCEREERKIPRKPALVRTRTERVSLFDEFFDRDF